MSGELLGCYIIGSVARGEDDERSDLDILAIVRDGKGKVSSEDILALVPDKERYREAGISWYGVNRIRQMFTNGELFAWHIWREHIILYERGVSLSGLGPPNSYRNALLDLESFERILLGSPANLEVAPENTIYEFGLLYVCLRNIAMSASGMLRDWPDFSRYSPYHLPEVPTLPMPRQEYDVAMECRMAGQRGISPPKTVDAQLVLSCYKGAVTWIGLLKELLRAQTPR